MIDINYTRMSNINNCNMKKIECVIMDWAGTSVDYGCFAPVAAFVDSFKQMGLTVTAAETRAHMGVTKIEEIRALFSIERVGKDFREKYDVTIPKRMCRNAINVSKRYCSILWKIIQSLFPVWWR